MKYTKKIAVLSGTSRKTLRYYDEIGLLKLGRINSSGFLRDAILLYTDITK